VRQPLTGLSGQSIVRTLSSDTHADPRVVFFNLFERLRSERPIPTSLFLEIHIVFSNYSQHQRCMWRKEREQETIDLQPAWFE
jgi:hypothetical protein